MLSRALIVILTGAFTFCGEETAEESTHFTYTVDGKSQNIEVITGLLQSEIQFEHKEQTLIIGVSNSLSRVINIRVSNWDFQTPPENGILEGEYDATFDSEQMNGSNPLGECLALSGDNAGVTLCDGGLVTFTLNGDVYTSTFDGNTGGTITIEESNPEKHSVTGTFSTKVKNFDGTELTIAGAFTNVKYVVF
jgi:hypothetical protein